MMKQIIAIILMIIILFISGFAIYYTLNMSKPPEPPKPKVISYEEGYWKGNYFFSFAKSRASQNIADENYVVVMDYYGNYVSYDSSSRYNFNYIYQISESEMFYIVRPANRSDPDIVSEARIWNFQTGATRTILQGIDIRGHHEFLIENGYFVTLRRVPGHEGGLDTVVHLDPKTGNETWVWSSEPLFPEKVCQMCSDDDWTHGNDVTVSLDDQYYYVNFRNTDNFVKVDRKTKEIEWICGYNGNFTLLENGIQKKSLWYHSHVIKEIKPNVFIMFDNDFHNRTHLDTYPPGEDAFVTNHGGQSRLIEITLDVSNMTAEITWSYTADVEYFSAIFGDIDVLPNGNIIGVFGTPAHNLTRDHEYIKESFGAAILEVNREGELVREYRFPYGCAIYRAQQLTKDTIDNVGSWLLEMP